MKKFTILFLIFCISLGGLTLEAGNITGRVTDENGLPLPGANIVVTGLNYGTSTDVNGFFALLNVKNGNIELTASYIGYQSSTKALIVEGGKTISQDFTLKPGLQLEEVVVGYQLKGQAKALNQQRSLNNITNIVASDQVGRFPDANIGDALKRIPGINVEYDQGEARFGHVRGTEPRLNSVMINGERIPSAEGEIRTVQLDLISSDMIKTIEVNKTLTPDMDADAIGGAINLVTLSHPANTRISATLGSGYNMISQKPTLTIAGLAGTRLAKNKLGVMLSFSYFDNPLGSDNIEAEWEKDDNGNVYTSDFQVRDYTVQRIRKSLSLSLDYKIDNNNTLFVSGIYNHRNDWENRYRRRYKDIEYDEDTQIWTTEIRRQTKAGSSDNKYARLEDQKTMSSRLGGKHIFNKVKVKWSISYSTASEERPNERYISYRAKGVEIIPDFSDERHPSFTVSDMDNADLNSNYSLKELTEENKYTDEKDLNGKIDIKIPLIEGNYKNSIKFGVRYRGKNKKRDNDFHEYAPLNEDEFHANTMNNLIDVSNSNFLAGNYMAGHFVNKNYLGELDLTNSTLFEKSLVNEELAGNYTAKEEITAAYIKFNQKLGEKLYGMIGLRVENTGLVSQGYSYNADSDSLIQTKEANDSYTNILPNLQIKYKFNSNNILRFAITNTLARPNYYDLVPYKEVYLEDKEIKIGNPNLKPTTSLNFDLMYENYFKSIGILSAGTFYKDIKNFIIEVEKRDYEYEGSTWDKFYQPLNGGDAYILGAEVAFQRNLDFLPGAWKGIGIYTNYTYIFSKVKNFQIEGREGEQIPLPGTPKSNFNASLSYEYKGLNLRLSGNLASSFRDSEGIGASEFYDRWYGNVFYLDANAYFVFAKHWKLFVELNNITNQPLYYYQGESNRVMQAEYYNMRINAGIKFDFIWNKK